MTYVSLNATTGQNGGPDRARAEMLDVRAVAELLRCSPRHVIRLADTGKMPKAMKLGALTRWSRSELSAWIAGGCKPLTHEGRAV